ncbi:MAG: phosphoribosylformylglycinamidine synthase subunit PurL [Candidatus Cloacimonetes bacterium]|nr:phosphoribosylformylglycinamidine synthase subunit PurL [Candidatus Cloacimonadota bacterium]
MNEPQITPELIKSHGINQEEYKLILQKIGREPTFTELGIISVMWSEHASYKNSIQYLKKLPREGKHLMTKTGEENAGVIDIGNGLGVSFKIESHNHPSALEPYHGAATGVGGILRDIFTMGARPIAVLDSLRFGNINNPQVKYLLKGVVSGIADYGNCFGVPTVGGEIYFEDSYEGNPLVNAMAIGILKHSNLMKASAKGVGNYVVYVGSDTGRDGIHGATFASVELTEESEESRTAVQVGDPFMEKLLLEATLEVIELGLVESIQDMGAAGLTCSSSEMAGKAGTGIELEISLVPRREEGMTPYEVMLSESQERMLLIVKPEKFAKVEQVFQKWDLHAVKVGVVTSDGMLRVKEHGDIKAELPAKMLVLGGDAPVYNRETKYPAYLEQVNKFHEDEIEIPQDLNNAMKKLISSPNICSKRDIYRQYDYMVQINTVVEPGSDAAVVRIKETGQGIAATVDCNGKYCYLNPYEGAKGAVAEAARNIVCSGARPLAITNCLNFGNPYKQEMYWTFTEVIRGMSDACLVFETPVTGGNVSFYNENPKGAVYPTPTIGMIGLLDDYHNAIKCGFQDEGDLIILLGDNCRHLGGTEYLKVCHDLIRGNPPSVDLEKEKLLYKTFLELASLKVIKSAHDCSDGGLAIAIAESCFNAEKLLGAEIKMNFKFRPDAELFGEEHSRIICSISPVSLDTLKSICEKNGFPYQIIGTVGGGNLVINDLINVEILELKKEWENALCL